MQIRQAQVKDITDLAEAFLHTVWKTQIDYFQKILDEQEKGQRVVLVARLNRKIVGFVNIIWKSKYPRFVEQGIPEINDLRVLEEYRHKGVAMALMDEVETRIFKRSPSAGLGVGLYADYGPAQKMYIRRGYVLDGRGLMYKEKPVEPGRDDLVDDDLLLYLTKKRP